MVKKKIRYMKVYNVRRYEDYKDTPTIIMKGDWLKEAGFDIGSSIQVECSEGKLIITPREEISFIDTYERQQAMMVAEKGVYSHE